jgi:multidrug efflux system outer membrane protein
MLTTAEVAETYFGALARHQSLRLLQEQIAADQEILALLEKRFAQGLGTQLDLLQQQNQLAQTKSLVPALEAELHVFENRLDLLLGVSPDGRNRLTSQVALPDLVNLGPIGAPSDLLLNRPDLRAQRLRLIAADESIASAIAERLPRFTLTGTTALVQGDGVSGPVSTLLGNLVQPLIDWGKRQAAVKRSQAIYTEGLLAFTQAFITAVGEVENSLYQEKKQRELLEKLIYRHEIVQQNLSKARAQFTQGITDYLTVLTALKALHNLERQMVAEQEKLLQNRIQLYRALGSMQPLDTIN